MLYKIKFNTKNYYGESVFHVPIIRSSKHYWFKVNSKHVWGVEDWCLCCGNENWYK